MSSRIRIIPVTILAASLLAGLKVGDVWTGIDRLVSVPAAEAEAKPQPAAAGHAAGAPTSIIPRVARQAGDKPKAADKPQSRTQPEKAAAAAGKPVPKDAPVAESATAAEAAHARPRPADRATLMAATEAGNTSPVMPPTPAASPPPPPPPPPPPQRDPSTYSKAELELLQSLAKRRDELDARTKQVEMREAVLAAAAKKVDEKIAELKQIKEQIQALLVKHDQQDEKQLQSLVKVYENMKPQDAARIFEKLEMPVLLDVVERMKERKLAPILAVMDPAKAKAITVELATKQQLPKTLAKGG